METSVGLARRIVDLADRPTMRRSPGTLADQEQDARVEASATRWLVVLGVELARAVLNEQPPASPSGRVETDATGMPTPFATEDRG